MLFRYPGGKNKIKKPILDRLYELAKYEDDIKYGEFFFGSGSIGIEFIRDRSKKTKVLLNDKDYGIACLWTAVIQEPMFLIDKIKGFIPSVYKFEQFKHDLIRDYRKDYLKTAFKKLVVHQTSYSGLGTKSGPLGGQNQKSEYNIGCRWNTPLLIKKIGELHKVLNSVNIIGNKCWNEDFGYFFNNKSVSGLIYLDPPYFCQGNNLYQEGMSVDDHVRLANLLRETHHKWVLSYDDCPTIRELYSWADITEIPVTYTINGAAATIELLIEKI